MSKRVFEQTATEVAAQDEDMVFKYSQRGEFRLCFMNSRTADAMLDAMVEENEIKGGFFYYDEDHFPVGPFETRSEAWDAAPDLVDEDE